MVSVHLMQIEENESVLGISDEVKCLASGPYNQGWYYNALVRFVSIRG